MMFLEKLLVLIKRTSIYGLTFDCPGILSHFLFEVNLFNLIHI